MSQEQFQLEQDAADSDDDYNDDFEETSPRRSEFDKSGMNANRSINDEALTIKV